MLAGRLCSLVLFLVMAAFTTGLVLAAVVILPGIVRSLLESGPALLLIGGAFVVLFTLIAFGGAVGITAYFAYDAFKPDVETND